jgi:hypothetical protein
MHRVAPQCAVKGPSPDPPPLEKDNRKTLRVLHYSEGLLLLGMPAATSSPTMATTRARSRRISGIAIFKIRRAIPPWRRSGSKNFFGIDQGGLPIKRGVQLRKQYYFDRLSPGNSPYDLPRQLSRKNQRSSPARPFPSATSDKTQWARVALWVRCRIHSYRWTRDVNFAFPTSARRPDARPRAPSPNSGLCCKSPGIDA